MGENSIFVIKVLDDSYQVVLLTETNEQVTYSFDDLEGLGAIVFVQGSEVLFQKEEEQVYKVGQEVKLVNGLKGIINHLSGEEVILDFQGELISINRVVFDDSTPDIVFKMSHIS